MFAVYCPGHRARVLLGSRSIDALVNTADGVDLHWTCRCGAHGVEHNGRHRRPSVAQPIESAA